MQYSKKFHIDGLDYRLDITNEGSISFYVIGGETRRAGFTPDHWKHDAHEFGMRDRNYFDNASKVFTKVGEIVVEFIKTKKPHTVYFTANNARKKDLYKKLASKLLGMINKSYFMFEDNGVYYFVKKED